MAGRTLTATLLLRLRDQLTGDLGRANGALKRHGNALRELDRKAKAIKGYQKLRTELRETRGAMERSKAKIRELKTAIETADGAKLNKLTAELDRVESKSKTTATVFGQQMDKMRQSIRELNGMNINPKGLNEAQDRIDRERKVREDADRRRRTGERVREGGRRVRQAGRRGTTGAVVGGYAGVRAVDNEYGFQLAANRTAAKLYGGDPNMTAEVAEERMRPLIDRAIEIARTRPQTGTDVMDAMRELAAAGFNEEQIQGAIEGVVDLATAGNLGMEEAADIATNVLTSMRLPMGSVEEVEASMARVGDVLSYVEANSNTDVQKLGESFKYAAPLAAQLGISVEQLGAFFGVMATNGIKSSEAGVAMRSAIVRLIKPTKGMRSALATLGMDVEDYYTRSSPLTANSVSASLRAAGTDVPGMENVIAEALAGDASGNALIEEIAEGLSNALGDDSVLGMGELRRQIGAAMLSGIEEMNLLGFLTDIYERSGGNPTSYMPHIFDQRQGGRINSMLVGQDPDDPFSGILPSQFLRNIDANSEGTTERQAGIIMNGMVGDLKRLQSALEALLRSLMDAGVADTIASVAESLTTLVNAISEANPRVLEFATYAALLALAVGPIMLAAGMVMGVIGKALTLSAAIRAARAAEVAADAAGGGGGTDRGGKGGRKRPNVRGKAAGGLVGTILMGLLSEPEILPVDAEAPDTDGKTWTPFGWVANDSPAGRLFGAQDRDGGLAEADGGTDAGASREDPEAAGIRASIDQLNSARNDVTAALESGDPSAIGRAIELAGRTLNETLGPNDSPSAAAPPADWSDRYGPRPTDGPGRRTQFGSKSTDGLQEVAAGWDIPRIKRTITQLRRNLEGIAASDGSYDTFGGKSNAIAFVEEQIRILDEALDARREQLGAMLDRLPDSTKGLADGDRSGPVRPGPAAPGAIKIEPPNLRGAVGKSIPGLVANATIAAVAHIQRHQRADSSYARGTPGPGYAQAAGEAWDAVEMRRTVGGLERAIDQMRRLVRQSDQAPPGRPSPLAAPAPGSAPFAFDSIAAELRAQSGRVQRVGVEGSVRTMPQGTQQVAGTVTTMPSGTQQIAGTVNVANPPVLTIPVSVQVNVKSGADPAAIGAAVGAAVDSRIRGSYSDGGG